MGRPDFKNCASELSGPRISCREMRSEMTFLNPSRKRVTKVDVDKCLFKNDRGRSRRCDFLVIDFNDVEHFVELKGSDVTHGVTQLQVAMERISKDAGAHKKFAYVIFASGSTPRTRIQRSKRDFKKKYNATLIVKRSPYETEL